MSRKKPRRLTHEQVQEHVAEALEVIVVYRRELDEIEARLKCAVTEDIQGVHRIIEGLFDERTCGVPDLTAAIRPLYNDRLLAYIENSRSKIEQMWSSQLVVGSPKPDGSGLTDS